MRMNKPVLLIIAIMMLALSNTHGQPTNKKTFTDANSKAVQIGQKVPDLLFDDLINYSSNSARLSDFKGKVVLLDFWATWCTPCIASQPKLMELQEKYKDKLQIIGITYESRTKIETFQKKFDGYRKIRLMGTTSDTSNRKYFPYKTIPHYVWIDGNGMLRSITDGSGITAENIEKMIASVDITATVKKELPGGSDPKNAWINDLLNRRMRTDQGALKYHSMLTGYIKGRISSSSGTSYATTAFKDRRLYASNLSILSLYRMAYGGEKYSKKNIFPTVQTIFDIQDTIQFDFTGSAYRDTSKLYCYDLLLPLPNSALLYKIMQQDLERVFALRGTIEVKPTRCLALVVTDIDKLKTKGGTPELDFKQFWIRMTNTPLSELFDALAWFNVGAYGKLPVLVNETGINPKIDLNISAKLNDYAGVRPALQAYGLDLIEVIRPIEILTLTDKVSASHPKDQR